MSYAFDTMTSVFRTHIRPLLYVAGKERLAEHFEELIQEMHSANHDVPSADGIFKGDGINKDPRVSRAARELDEYVKQLDPPDQK